MESVVITSTAPGRRRRNVLQEPQTAVAVVVQFIVFLADMSKVEAAQSLLIQVVDDGEQNLKA